MAGLEMVGTVGCRRGFNGSRPYGMYLTWSLLNAAAFKGIPYASGCSCPRALRNQPSMLRGRHQYSWERPKGFRSWRHSSKAALVHRMSSEGFGLMVSLHPLQPWQRGVRAGDSLNNLRLAARAAWRERLHPCPMSSRRPLPRPSASRAHALRAAGRCQGNGGFARRGTSSCWRPHAPPKRRQQLLD